MFILLWALQRMLSTVLVLFSQFRCLKSVIINQFHVAFCIFERLKIIFIRFLCYKTFRRCSSSVYLYIFLAPHNKLCIFNNVRCFFFNSFKPLFFHTLLYNFILILFNFPVIVFWTFITRTFLIFFRTTTWKLCPSL